MRDKSAIRRVWTPLNKSKVEIAILRISLLTNPSSGDVGNQGCGTWSRDRFGIVLGSF